jgi:hypothetical protein
MWQFKNMSQAAFKAYAALPNVSSVDKISMCQKYDLSRTDLVGAYLEICARTHPPSVEEGNQVEELALITHTQQECRERCEY